ncbi:MAG TPA: malate synthase A [bacterium]|nr:malate synthase A [bacterium]
MNATARTRDRDPAPQPIAPVPGMELPAAAWTSDAQIVLTPKAAELLVALHRHFEPERRALLAARRERQAAWDGGELPDFPPRDTEAVRGGWRVAPIPEDLLRRRVEITGPCNSPKMVINMLGRAADGIRADTAMLDFEDALMPAWGNLMAGQRNVRAVAEGQLEHEEPAGGGKPRRVYRLDPADMALPIVRPRGLHLLESNCRVDSAPVSGALFDLALSCFHSAGRLLERGHTPAYYLPKCEDAAEARWWDAVLAALEDALGLGRGALKATFLIETLPAALQMEEILFASRDHAVGLNVGRWDKIFSDIKTLRFHADRILADRASITMQRPWMEAYARRCVQISHQRGALGLGGMAAFTPGRTPAVRAAQTEKVRADKRTEHDLGHDGCWVSHPYFIGPALEQFPERNQLGVLHREAERYPDLLPQGGGPYTLAGLRTNVRVGIGYLEGWQRGIGCVAWEDLMEDLATLEISRAQTWQWLHHGVRLQDGDRAGPAVTEALVRRTFAEELERIVGPECADLAAARGESPAAVAASFERAAREAEAIFTRSELTDFLYEASPPVA